MKRQTIASTFPHYFANPSCLSTHALQNDISAFRNTGGKIASQGRNIFTETLHIPTLFATGPKFPALA